MPEVLSWNAGTSSLDCVATISEDQYRELLTCYTGTDRAPHHQALKVLRESSKRFVVPDEISKLESWAKRIRGEIFFSNKWLLCEGQAEYAILGAVAEVLGCPLDAHGISVIDYQNNGSPGAFAALARALDYPWAMVCDGDKGGNDHIAQLKSHNFAEVEIKEKVIQLSKNVDLEALLIGGKLRPCVLAAIRELSPEIADTDAALLEFAGSHKEEVAVRISAHIRSSAKKDDIPAEFQQLFIKIGACT
jgi:putative ATP-dependent endonuclease of OLD family